MKKLTDEAIEEVISSDEVMRACPAVVAKVTDAAADPDTTARDLAKIVSTDEGISAKILKLVNSAFYGMSGEISTITQATIILGMREILSLVYSIPTRSLYGSPDAGIDGKSLWEHSVLTAAISREISYFVKYQVPEEVFVAGIIHDVGKAIISRILGNSYTVLIEESSARGLDHEEAERALIGVPHTVVGRRLLGRWNFPAVLQEAVMFHHNPVVDGKVKPVAGIVYVGNRLARTPPEVSFGVVLSGLLGSVVEALGLGRRSIAEAYMKAGRSFEELKQIHEV
ncbi:MAG: HDOD domain-containing protein [Planctomycetes bacterium]|nr:HDOD domain-containing protein [Planctomycetota bacterium]